MNGRPCLSVPSIRPAGNYLASLSWPRGISSLEQRTLVSLWMCTLHVDCGAALETAVSLLSEPEATSQLGKLALTSARKRL